MLIRDVPEEQETQHKKRYHRRGLAGRAVSVVKPRFGRALYSKKRRGKKNELRLKVITNNLTIIARLATTIG